MIPSHLKLRTQPQHDKSISIRGTEYGDSKNKSSYIRQKLTRGKNKYNEIKNSYSKGCDSHCKENEKQCTFDPRASSNRKSSHSRSFKKFMEDQESFQKNKENRIRSFKTEIIQNQAEENCNRPSIDRISRRICTLTNYDQQDVVDRLYQKKVFEGIKDDEDLFSPKILPKSKSLKRNKKVSELLHQDATRRQQRRDFLEMEKGIRMEQIPQINKNATDLVLKKIQGEFNELISEEETEVPLVMAWSAISEIFNINPNKNDEEANYCIEMMNYLCEDGNEMISRTKLWEFIEIIVKREEAEVNELGEKMEPILQVFGNLYKRRVTKRKAEVSPEPYSFAPQILKSSDRHAEKHRDKMLRKAKQFIETGNISLNIPTQVRIQDIFMIEHMMKIASNEKKKLNKDNEEMKQCTFKPKIISTPKYHSGSTSRFLPPKGLSHSTSKITYCSNATKFHGHHQKNMSSLEATMIQSTALTQSLNPSGSVRDLRSASQSRFRNSLEKPEFQVKNAEKTILRMAVAREQRELSNEMRSRGYPGNVKNWTAYTKDKKQKVVNQHKKLKGYAYSKITLR